MTPEIADTAQRAGERMRVPEPWDLLGQKLRRYEVYFDGTEIETVRGPIIVEGVGLRVFRPRGESTAVGFQGTTDLSAPGLAALGESAERLAGYATFPAKQVELPSDQSIPSGSAEVLDPALWADPVARVKEYVDALLSAFPSSGDPAPSFGSLKATLIENSITNSQGLSVRYGETLAELEVAVKSAGGPEGAAPGEYWLSRELRRLESAPLSAEVATWCQRASDVRRAKQPHSGQLSVGLPASLLAEILPAALEGRFSGAGRLRKIAVEAGSQQASDSITLYQDPTVPWSIGSSPRDDEGTPTSVVPLLERGVVSGLFYDCLHAAAFDLPSNGSAARTTDYGRKEWLRFSHRPVPHISTIAIRPGDGGPDPELIESVKDGIWIDQLGWPNPNTVSSAFGGEIRIGYRIQNGRITEPVRGGTLGGLTFAAPGTPSLLGSVAALGSAPTLVGNVFAPSMVVAGLTVSGEG